MPEVTNPELLRQLNGPTAAPGLPTAPVPFPGARMPMPSVNAKQVAQQQAEARLGLDYNQDRRAEASMQNENARLRIAQEEADQKRREREANSGVTTTGGQDTATSHVISLTTDLGILDDIRKKDPNALHATWGEKLAGLANDPDIESFAKSPQRQRATSAYKNIIESALYLKTGAAYNSEQFKGQVEALTPQMYDSPEALADKRLRLLGVIEGAKAVAGPGNVKAQAALDRLAQYSDVMYQPNPLRTTNKETGGQTELSGEKAIIPIPPAMQQDYIDWLAQHPPGTLTVEDYIAMRRGLDKKYDFGESDYQGASDYVDKYNKNQADLTLPGAERELSGAGKITAEMAADPGLIGDLYTGGKSFTNAMTLGIPEFLAGREGRMASDAADAAHPKSALAGDILGSIAPVIGLENLAARGANKFLSGEVAKRVMAETAANAGYGAARGGLEANPEDRGAAINQGALLGGAGALGSRALVKGARGFLPDRTSEALENLRAKEFTTNNGVQGKVPATDLTTMQRAGMGSAEESIQGIPGIAGAREKAVESWNRQNSARVLARIGEELPKDIEAGQAANDYVNQRLSAAFNTIRPKIKGKVDKPFTDAVNALKVASIGSGSPERRQLWREIDSALKKFNKAGNFDGEGYRELSTQLRRLNEVWTANKDAALSTATDDMARAAEKVRRQAQALVNRANPQIGAQLKQLETAWAHQMRIDLASRGAAKSTRGVYAPDEYLSSIERMDTSKNKASISRGKGFDQKYAQDAREIMSGKPAKKASVFQTAAAAGATHFGGAPAIVAAAGLGAGYVPKVKRLVQAIIDGKLGDTADAVGQSLKQKTNINLIEKGISGDALNKVIAQALRAKAEQEKK